MFHVGGKRLPIPTGINVPANGVIPKEVKDMYAAKLVELGRGTLKGGKQLRFEDLREAVVRRMTKEGLTNPKRLKALKNAQNSYRHLAKKFAGWLVSEITDEAIEEYAIARALPVEKGGEGAAVCSVNMELGHLRRAYTLKKIPPPLIEKLKGGNKRRNIVPDEFLKEIMARLNPYWAALIWFMRLTGWRGEESSRLEWRQVDFEARCIRLDETKSGKPRERAFDEHVEALLRDQKAKQEAAGIITRWVFAMEDGRQVNIESLRSRWPAVCREVGYTGGGSHNLRRTRIREQEMQGIPPFIGMAMTGIETPTVYRDYVSASVKEQAAWLEKHPPAVVSDSVVLFPKKAEKA